MLARSKSSVEAALIRAEAGADFRSKSPTRNLHVSIYTLYLRTSHSRTLRRPHLGWTPLSRATFKCHTIYYCFLSRPKESWSFSAAASVSSSHSVPCFLFHLSASYCPGEESIMDSHFWLPRLSSLSWGFTHSRRKQKGNGEILNWAANCSSSSLRTGSPCSVWCVTWRDSGGQDSRGHLETLQGLPSWADSTQVAPSWLVRLVSEGTTKIIHRAKTHKNHIRNLPQGISR